MRVYVGFRDRRRCDRKRRRFGHLDACCGCDLSQLLFFPPPFLLFALIYLFLRLDTYIGLHILETSFVMVGIRVGVLIVLRYVFELLIAKCTIESFEGVGNLALKGTTPCDRVLQ